MTGRTSIMILALSMCMWTGMAYAMPSDFNRYQYVFEQDVFSVMPGGTVEVPVYFQETVGLHGTSVLAPGGIGIVGAGLHVFTMDFSESTQPAQLLSISDIKPNSEFDFYEPSLSLNGGKLALGKLEDPAVDGEECSPGVYRLLLGTFRFTAGDVVGESTPICVSPYDPGFANFVTEDEIVLDSVPLLEARAMITVVPEPGSLVLTVVAIFAAMAWKIGLKRQFSHRVTQP